MYMIDVSKYHLNLKKTVFSLLLMSLSCSHLCTVIKQNYHFRVLINMNVNIYVSGKHIYTQTIIQMKYVLMWKYVKICLS